MKKHLRKSPLCVIFLAFFISGCSTPEIKDDPLKKQVQNPVEKKDFNLDKLEKPISTRVNLTLDQFDSLRIHVPPGTKAYLMGKLRDGSPKVVAWYNQKNRRLVVAIEIRIVDKLQKKKKSLRFETWIDAPGKERLVARIHHPARLKSLIQPNQSVYLRGKGKEKNLSVQTEPLLSYSGSSELITLGTGVNKNLTTLGNFEVQSGDYQESFPVDQERTGSPIKITTEPSEAGVPSPIRVSNLHPSQSYMVYLKSRGTAKVSPEDCPILVRGGTTDLTIGTVTSSLPGMHPFGYSKIPVEETSQEQGAPEKSVYVENPPGPLVIQKGTDNIPLRVYSPQNNPPEIQQLDGTKIPTEMISPKKGIDLQEASVNLKTPKKFYETTKGIVTIAGGSVGILGGALGYFLLNKKDQKDEKKKEEERPVTFVSEEEPPGNQKRFLSPDKKGKTTGFIPQEVAPTKGGTPVNKLNREREKPGVPKEGPLAKGGTLAKKVDPEEKKSNSTENPEEKIKCCYQFETQKGKDSSYTLEVLYNPAAEGPTNASLWDADKPGIRSASSYWLDRKTNQVSVKTFADGTIEVRGTMSVDEDDLKLDDTKIENLCRRIIKHTPGANCPVEEGHPAWASCIAEARYRIRVTGTLTDNVGASSGSITETAWAKVGVINIGGDKEVEKELTGTTNKAEPVTLTLSGKVSQSQKDGRSGELGASTDIKVTDPRVVRRNVTTADVRLSGKTDVLGRCYFEGYVSFELDLNDMDCNFIIEIKRLQEPKIQIINQCPHAK